MQNNNKANRRDLIAVTGLITLLKFDSNHQFSAHVTLQYDGWPRKAIGHNFLYYDKLGVSLQIHLWIQTGVTVQRCWIRIKIDDLCLSRVTLKPDRWPWKTTGHLVYATSSFFALFQSHWWIQTWVTVRKRSIRIKIGDFLSRKSNGWLGKTIGHLFYADYRQFVVLCDLEIWWMTFKNNRSYGLETAKLGFDICDLELWPLTLTFCMVLILSLVITNKISWCYDDGDIMKTVW